MKSRLKKAPALLTAASLLVLAGMTPLDAQPVPGAEAGCPNVDPSLPIAVGADQSEFQKTDSQVVLTGNVTIVQGVLTLFADNVIIKYHAGETRDMGTQGTISSLLAEGTVKVECESDRAHGRRALYNVAEKTIALTGDVLLVRGENILKGERLTIDLATGNTAVEGASALTAGEAQKDTRVKAVFMPPPEDTDDD